MNNKTNILEELDRMKNLIVTKRGAVISEQSTNVGTDVGSIMQELNKTNSDESKIVNTIKKYKSKAEFDNFLAQYKSISGKDFGVDLYRAIQPYNDKTEWNDLKTHLATLGVTLGSSSKDKGRTRLATFGGAAGSTAAALAPEEIQRREGLWRTTYNCVPNQPGAKQLKLKDGTTTYLINGVYYYNLGRKKLADGKMVAYSCTTEFRAGSSNSGQRSGQSSVNSRFTDSVKSLGIQGGKMDLQTLQSILKTLEGEQSTATGTPSVSTGTPDLAQLTAALNQLQS